MEESRRSTVFRRRRNERSVEAIGSGQLMNAGIGTMEVKTAQIVVEYRCREGDMRIVRLTVERMLGRSGVRPVDGIRVCVLEIGGPSVVAPTSK